MIEKSNVTHQVLNYGHVVDYSWNYSSHEINTRLLDAYKRLEIIRRNN